MKKFLVYVILFAFAILTISSCSIKLNRDSVTSANTPAASSSDTPANAPTAAGGDTAANSPASSDPANSAEPSGSTESTGQEITDAATEPPADNGVTLETIRKGAQDAGFTMDDNKDMQQSIEPKAVDGFIINYQDENSYSQVPVYEFSSPADAQSYADEVNKEGYCLCIINGKLLGITSSRYGIVLNDKEKALLETLFKSRMMAYEEPAPDVINPSKDFAGDCSRIGAINKAIDTLVNKSVLLYSKSLPADDPNINIGLISFSSASSSDMAFIAALCEDQAQMDSVVKYWKLFGCTDVKLKHDAANEYTLTGKRAGMDTSFVINCVYSPDMDSLRILDKDGSQIADYFEFVPLGGDKYAFQTLYERAVVEYKEGKITSLIYSRNTTAVEKAYSPDADSIYPNGTGLDDAWASKAGEDTYEQFITFDGTKLDISAVDYTGTKLNAEIIVK